jgi:anti-anti-sigma factor
MPVTTPNDRRAVRLFHLETVGALAVIAPAAEVENLPESSLQIEAESVLNALRESPPRAVVMDLGEVGFFGSAFISILVRIHKIAQQNGGKMVLAAVGERIKELMQMTALNTVWSSYDTRAEALSVLGDRV